MGRLEVMRRMTRFQRVFLVLQAALDLRSMPIPEQASRELRRNGDPLRDGLFRDRATAAKVSLTSDYVMDRVTDFASSGLRTLVMGARLVRADEWNQMKQTLDAARGSLEGRDVSIAEAYKAIESNLMLVGCTGIEDKLQDGVPETLIALREAGIQVCARVSELR